MVVCVTNRVCLVGSLKRLARSPSAESILSTRSFSGAGSHRWPVTQHRRIHTGSQEPDDTPGSGGVFKPAESEEEWLELDGKVNEYPTSRTFKAIGTGGQEFADSMVAAVEKVTTRTVDKRFQVVKRPSREGKYLSVSIRSVTVDSGRQVLDVFREMKSTGGRQLKFII